jgi:hypothetical protein
MMGEFASYVGFPSIYLPEVLLCRLWGGASGLEDVPDVTLRQLLTGLLKLRNAAAHFGRVDKAWLGDAVKVLSWLGAPPSVVEEATTIASSTLSGVERLMQHFHKQVGGFLRSSLGTHYRLLHRCH